MSLILVRHGRTDRNARHQLSGRADVALDATGRIQAASVARHLGPVDRVLASPLRRALDTARAIGDAAVDDRWIELDYGDFEGRPLGDIDAETWAAWRADPGFAPPGGESLAALGRRVRDACHALVDDIRERDVVVVSHVSPIKAAVAWALGVDDRISWRLHLSPASITRIGWGRGGPAVHSFNETQHLDGG